jgi:hypothetical protein
VSEKECLVRGRLPYDADPVLGGQASHLRGAFRVLAHRIVVQERELAKPRPALPRLRLAFGCGQLDQAEGVAAPWAELNWLQREVKSSLFRDAGE